MKYLKLYQDIINAEATGKGLDDVGRPLDGEETKYLMQNVTRMPALGGDKLFYQRFAKALGVDLEGKSDSQLKVDLKEAVAALPVEPPNWEDTDNPLNMLSRAISALQFIGNGRKAKELLEILHPNHAPGAKVQETLLTGAVHSEFMHYLLHEDADKEMYLNTIIKQIHDANFINDIGDHSKRFSQIIYRCNADALDVVMDALPLESRQIVCKNIERLSAHFADNAKSKILLKHYPSDQLAQPHAWADKGPPFDQMPNAKDVELIKLAIGVDAPEFVRSILQTYHEQNRLDALLEEEGETLLSATSTKCNTECIAAIIEADQHDILKTKATGRAYIALLRKSLEYNDRRVFELTQRIRPQVKQSPLAEENGLIALGKMTFQPDQEIDQELIAAFAEMSSDNRAIALTRIASNAKLMRHVAQLMPEEFKAYVKWRKFETYASRQELLAGTPERLVDEIKATLKHKKLQDDPYYQGHDSTAIGKWRRAFDNAEWVETLPATIYQQNPCGFSIEAYQQFLPLAQMACKVEGNTDAELNAYKLTVLFGGIKKAEQYLTKFAPRDESQALHDALLFDIPRAGQWDIESWQQFALRDGMGPRALRLLALAPKIEQEFASKPSLQWTNKERHRFKEINMDQLYDLARRASYRHSAEAPELANLCIELGVDEARFDQARGLLNNPDVREKRTPHVHIKGEDVGFPGYEMKRVYGNHPWCAFIGKMVNCCNYLGGATEDMAVAQIEHPDCSLYVITNKDNIPIAKCTGWMSDKGNFVFNAWERLSPSYDKMCEPFLLAAGVQTIKGNEGIQRVTLGANKGNANFVPITDIERPAEQRLASADADRQFEVVTREKLKLAETKLASLTKKNTGRKAEPEESIEPWVLRKPDAGRYSLSA